MPHRHFIVEFIYGARTVFVRSLICGFLTFPYALIIGYIEDTLTVDIVYIVSVYVFCCYLTYRSRIKDTYKKREKFVKSVLGIEITLKVHILRLFVREYVAILAQMLALFIWVIFIGLIGIRTDDAKPLFATINTLWYMLHAVFLAICSIVIWVYIQKKWLKNYYELINPPSKSL